MSRSIACIFMILSFSSCVLFANHHSSLGKVRLNNIIIYSHKHDTFHYLVVIDRAKSFRLLYPVGEENFRFTGGLGPIHHFKKHEYKTGMDYFMVTDIKKDEVCFLNYCYSQNGSLTEISQKDKDIINTIDSFCKKKYSFYSIEIDKFKNWYSTEK